MTYHALRSSLFYLDMIAQIRRINHPHHLISVVGGLAFLHALNSNTRRITLVDRDKDTLDYWNRVHSLIRQAQTLDQFKRAVVNLTEEYGAGEDVQLHGQTLERGKFSWHFGEGNLATEESYHKMRNALLASKVIVLNCDLEALSYDCHPYPVVVMLSNTDSPLFAKERFAVLNRIMSTATTEARCFSWMMDVTFKPNPDNFDYENFKDS